jgi:hypothetical protein
MVDHDQHITWEDAKAKYYPIFYKYQDEYLSILYS